MRARWWIAVFAVGLVVGAGGLRLAEAVTVDAAIERQKASLVRLTKELGEKEAALVARQALVGEQATRLHDGLSRAAALADQISQTQGSAVDRLKGVLAALRKIQAELASIN